MRKKAVRIGVLAVALLLGFAAVRTAKKRKEALGLAPPPKALPVLVESAPLETGVFPVGKSYLGTVRAKVEADISSRVEERILKLELREGDRVKKGDLICVLDDRVERARVSEIRSKLEAAETALATQEGIYKRDLTLFKNKALSAEELDVSRARMDAARGEVEGLKAELKAALAELSFTRIKAPFSGVVTKRYRDPGDLAIPGAPILSIEATDQGYYVEIRVPQDEFPRLKPGRAVRLSLKEEAGKGGILAEISRIHPAIRAGTLATVEVDLKERPFGLPTGAVVNAFIELGRVEGVRVPVRALLQDVDKTFCYFLDEENRVRIRPVKILWTGERFAVLSGLPRPLPGRRVVTAAESALLRLHEGERVGLLQEGRGKHML